jgi:hypothetical protein
MVVLATLVYFKRAGADEILMKCGTIIFASRRVEAPACSGIRISRGKDLTLMTGCHSRTLQTTTSLSHAKATAHCPPFAGLFQIRTLRSKPNSSHSQLSTSSHPPLRSVSVKGGRSSSFLKFSLRLGQKSIRVPVRYRRSAG